MRRMHGCKYIVKNLKTHIVTVWVDLDVPQTSVNGHVPSMCMLSDLNLTESTFLPFFTLSFLSFVTPSL